MDYFENIVESIGNTPLIKLNSIVKDLPCTVLAKYETFNPGNSVKDRIGLKMILAPIFHALRADTPMQIRDPFQNIE